MTWSKLLLSVIVKVSGAITYIFHRRFFCKDAGYQRYQDSGGNEIGLERSGGTYRAVIILTNAELDWFYFTDYRAAAHRIELFETRVPERCWKIMWGPGTLLLHAYQLEQLEPWVTHPDDTTIQALFEEVQKRDDVRWALESELFQAGAATDLPQPIVESPVQRE